MAEHIAVPDVASANLQRPSPLLAGDTFYVPPDLSNPGLQDTRWELIGDEIVASAVPFSLEPFWDFRDDWTVSTLRAMSAVHRSWRPIAQSRLRRRVVLRKESELLNYAYSPSCGAHLRDFCFVETGPLPNYFYHGEVDDAGRGRPTAEALTVVLQRATNLRFFACRFAFLYGRHEFLGELRQFGASLRGLWLDVSAQCDNFPLASLCLILPDLNNLELLYISAHWIKDAFEKIEISDKLVGKTPSEKLKTVELIVEGIWGSDFKDRWTYKALAWILAPRDSFTVNNLMAQLTSDIPEFLSSVGGLLASLTSLFLEYNENDTLSYVSSTMAMIGVRCATLRKLYVKLPLKLGPHNGTSISSPLGAFRTIEEVNIGFSNALDSDLQALLSVTAHPSLRKVFIDLTNEVEVDDCTPLSTFALAFPLTIEACQRAGFTLLELSDLRACFDLFAMDGLDNEYAMYCW